MIETKIQWKKGYSSEIITSHRMHWESRCGRYRVTRSTSKFEKMTRRGKRVASVYFHAEMWIESAGRFEFIDETRHKTRAAAERACNNHHGG